MDGVKHFAKFLAEEFKKQNLNKIKAKHLIEYVEQMQEWGYSKSYVNNEFIYGKVLRRYYGRRK